MTTFDIYESFKMLVNEEEAEFAQILSYFQERLLIENHYSKEMDRLSKKFAQMGGRQTRTINNSIISLLDETLNCTTEQGKVRIQLIKAIDLLFALKKQQDVTLRQMKDHVKPIAKSHSDLLSLSIPKSKQLYYKKAEMEIANIGNSEKLYKISKDVGGLEHAYREGIIHLEESRLQVMAAREVQKAQYGYIIKDRNVLLQQILSDFAHMQQIVLSKLTKNMEAFKLTTENINVDSDCELQIVQFHQCWPVAEQVYFEHFKNQVPAKGMIFGVPLSISCRHKPDLIPPLLKKLFDAIESRGMLFKLFKNVLGISVEGLYRVSGKMSDGENLRIQLEVDVNSVDLMDDTIDVHLLTGLVKSFFRDLPDPLIIFAPKERADYSAIPSSDERIIRIRQRMRSMPKEKQAVLKALISHLVNITNESSENKMTISNISLIFSAVLFSSQTEVIAEPAAVGWFGIPKAAPEPVPTLSSYDAMKKDLVLIVFVNYYRW
ncbi:Rho GTPase activation protein [Globomyces pollinis-pini]|nr:Rho GTPase activation protein [Globomyces pollinis-pini]